MSSRMASTASIRCAHVHQSLGRETAGFGDGEDAFEEAAASFALSAEGQLAIDHGGT